MRILSYPSLINRQIIQEMEPSAIFMLSKTSKKMKDLVKNNIYKVDQVWIASSSYVTFVIEIDAKFYNVLISSDDPGRTMGCRSGVMVNTVLLHSSAVDDSREIISNHNYICEIFKCGSNRISVVDSTLCKPRGSPEDVKISIKLLMNVDFCILRILGVPHTTYMKIPNLIIHDAKFFASNFIYRYEGENILLKTAWLVDINIIMFILNWMSKRKENLVTFVAFQNDRNVFDDSSVVNLLNSKRNAITESRVEDWDPKKRERYFKYDSIIANNHIFPADTFDCEHGYDIVREDGKRATVKISPNYFMFFVWP